MKNIFSILIIVTVVSGAYIFGAFGAAVCCMGTPVQDKTPLTVIMYHNITAKPALRGKYAVTVHEFESDLLYLQKNGYTGISMAQLYDYAYNGTPLPDKPVIITFDDGYESFLVYAYPLLEKYGYKAVVNVVGAYAEKYTALEAEHNPDCHNADYAYLNKSAIKMLADSGTVEIGCHTYNMHSLKNRKGCARAGGESIDDYCAALTDDVRKFDSLLCDALDKRSDIFAYPYGSFSQETPEILRKLGYKAVFDCTEKINYISNQNIDWLFCLHRYNRPSGISSESFFAKMG